ncbi:hypothetical protein DICPUDRAFT_74626 [Dictyostelium purpureum]|uniref:Uncharacterized protein n=1 Tax=Dictyostelium purpureum TaxID=5786 RepID=F0Z8A6_DICPU|nr:uncharacterized protein DICPUDRAFT_74626 [Dictyostelium purpureum]EGC39782.1 hypothetical protein DICPUDRAFT_74626 [Dictyostelium purpureum]|eukprot:XP_003283649.1 hypothetical protein DICPUDRAFT_74626 [Dictyostelium purpureum]
MILFPLKYNCGIGGSEDKNQILFAPFISFLASLFFIYDIWNFYLPNSIGYSRVNPSSKSFVNLKLVICFVLFTLSCTSIVLSFNLTFNDVTIWNFLNIIFGIIWAMLTVKYQKYNEQNTNERDFKELNQLTVDDKEMIEGDV